MILTLGADGAWYSDAAVLQQYAMPILILVLYLLPMWTGIDVIGRYFDVTVYPLAEQLLNFAIAGI